MPILGLTATATSEMVKELKEKLVLRDPLVFSISFNRKNLDYQILNVKRNDRFDRVCELLNSKFKDVCGIIYTATIKE